MQIYYCTPPFVQVSEKYLSCKLKYGIKLRILNSWFTPCLRDRLVLYSEVQISGLLLYSTITKRSSELLYSCMMPCRFVPCHYWREICPFGVFPSGLMFRFQLKQHAHTTHHRKTRYLRKCIIQSGYLGFSQFTRSLH